MIDLQWLHNHPTEVFECIAKLEAENRELKDQVERFRMERDAALYINDRLTTDIQSAKDKYFKEGVISGFMVSSEGFNGQCDFSHRCDMWEVDNRDIDDFPQEALIEAVKFHSKFIEAKP